MSSSWRRFSLQQFSPLQFTRKKSEPHPPNTLVPDFNKSQRSISPLSQRKSKKKDKNGFQTIESSSSSEGGIVAEIPHHPSSSNMIGSMGPSAGTTWHHDSVHPGVSGIDGNDEMDGSQPQESRSTDTEEQFVEVDEQKAHLISKIERIKEKLKAANKTQQADVDEFLKVTADIPNTADNPQLMRIRQVFDKKNRKSAQLIQTLQKKMESYQQRLKNVEAGISRKTKGDNVLSNVGQGLKDVGANIKESISGYTGGVIGNIKEGFINASQNAAETMISVPKDLAHKLLKKSGSADNIVVVSKAEMSLSPNNIQTMNVGGIGSRSVHGGGGNSIFYTSLTEDNRQQSMPAAVSSLAHSQQQQQQTFQQQKLVADHHQNVPNVIFSNEDQHQQHLFNSNMERFFGEVTKIREDIQKTQTMIEEMRAQTQQEYTYFNGALHEEKYRAQRLEDQINDQAELHQAEVTNLRQEIQNLEGRLTYQVNSRMQDMHDDYGKLANEVSSLKSRIKEVQQFIGMEGFEGMSLRAKCRRGVMLLAQFFADLLLWIVSLMNAQHVKVMLTVLLFALVIYHVGGYLVWNVLYSLIRHFVKRTNSTVVEDDSLLNSTTPVTNVGTT